MKIRYINGDITETELKHIAHGVNCQNQMHSGVAKALFTKWPGVKEQYHAYMNSLNEKGRKPEDYLGTPMDAVEVEPGKFVHNLFTQLNYGYDGARYVNYNAVVTSLKFITYKLDTPLAIPKIGCGVAGGSWLFMEQLLLDAFVQYEELELWVYDNTAKPSGKNDFA
jgi:O-acetyl-ADP-ribose deacetylase (regulator of RNase III)